MDDMEVRYIEFFDLGHKSAVTYLNEFIKENSYKLKVDVVQFAFDSEGCSSILAKVEGSSDAIAQLEKDYEDGVDGSVI